MQDGKTSSDWGKLIRGPAIIKTMIIMHLFNQI